MQGPPLRLGMRLAPSTTWVNHLQAAVRPARIRRGHGAPACNQTAYATRHQALIGESIGAGRHRRQATCDGVQCVDSVCPEDRDVHRTAQSLTLRCSWAVRTSDTFAIAPAARTACHGLDTPNRGTRRTFAAQLRGYTEACMKPVCMASMPVLSRVRLRTSPWRATAPTKTEATRAGQGAVPTEAGLPFHGVRPTWLASVTDARSPGSVVASPAHRPFGGHRILDQRHHRLRLTEVPASDAPPEAARSSSSV